MGRLAEMVEELEQEANELENTVNSLEDDINELEGQLELANHDIKKLQDFEDWVHDAYPDVFKAYQCVVDIKEK